MVWCRSGFGLLGLQCVVRGNCVSSEVGVIIIIVMIRFLDWVNCHRNRACQERDPRDSYILDMFNALMSESWLRSARCHKDRDEILDDLGAGMWEKCAH